ncbi:MAG: SpoIID/LytB domain-containing protein, partial [Planctomycetes bacterium]|nr:SpoIID/LytB domain-containing protein [Planctomycetota bacterium]
MLCAALAGVLVSGCSCEKPRVRPRPEAPFAAAEHPLMRVRLGEEAPSAWVAVTAPWRLTGPAGQLAAGERLDWTEVAFRGGGAAFGSQAPVPGGLELAAESDGAIRVRQTIGGKERERCYRGVLRILPTTAGALRLINILPLENYVAGVLSNELPKAWHAEAYKAQAVAARTYALAERNSHQRYDFDVYDSTLSQVYGGAGTETASAWDAVLATWGIVATYRTAAGKAALLTTYFHSTCG